jgi:hypothetical protein
MRHMDCRATWCGRFPVTEDVQTGSIPVQFARVNENNVKGFRLCRNDVNDPEHGAASRLATALVLKTGERNSLGGSIPSSFRHIDSPSGLWCSL